LLEDIDARQVIEDDEEMVEGVQVYLDYIRSLPCPEKFIEYRVNYSEYAPEGFGTADFIGYDNATKTLHVADLKFGKGVKVSAQGNTQGRLYALGALEEFSAILRVDRVVISIVQPRLDHIDEETLTTEELLRWGEWVRVKAEETQDPNAPRIPGEKQCQWCAHKALCPELLELTRTTLAAEFDDLTPVNRINDSQLKTVLDNAKLIRSFLDAAEDHVKTRVLEGVPFPGYKLVEGRSSREWADEDEAQRVLLSSGYENTDIFEQKFLSPAKAEKLIGKKKADLITALVVKKSGAPTLVPEDDKRPAIGFSIENFDEVS
jgi:hypothetical protein